MFQVPARLFFWLPGQPPPSPETPGSLKSSYFCHVIPFILLSSNPFNHYTLVFVMQSFESKNPFPQCNLLNEPFEVFSKGHALVEKLSIQLATPAKQSDVSGEDCVLAASLLENMAGLLLQARLSVLVSVFVHLLLLHITTNKLFNSLLKKLVCGHPADNEQNSNADCAAGQEPDWWCQLQQLGSVLGTSGAAFAIWCRSAGSSCSLTLQENKDLIACIASNLKEILQALGHYNSASPKPIQNLQSSSITSKYSTGTKPPINDVLVDWPALSNLMIREDVGEIASFCLLQSSNAVESLIEFYKSGKTDAQTSASVRVMELLCSKPSLIFIAQHGSAPGADSIIKKFFDAPKPAFISAYMNPTHLLCEVLCHKKLDLMEFPILPHCQELAAHRVECLATYNMLALLKTHNETNRSSSITTILCDAVYLTSLNIHLSHEDNFNFCDPFETIFVNSDLPPVARKNYFYASTYPCSRSSLSEQLKLKNFVLLLASTIGCLFRALQPLISQEFLEGEFGEAATVLEHKLKMIRVEKIFAAVVAAFLSLEASGDSPLAEFVKRDGIAVLRKILQSLRTQREEPSTYKEVVWIPIFNLANDICFSDILLAPAVLKIFERFAEDLNLENNEGVISSALSQLFSTFDDGTEDYPNVAKLTTWDRLGVEETQVSREEYEFLIDFSNPVSSKGQGHQNRRLSDTFASKKNDVGHESKSRTLSSGCKKSSATLY